MAARTSSSLSRAHRFRPPDWALVEFGARAVGGTPAPHPESRQMRAVRGVPRIIPVRVSFSSIGQFLYFAGFTHSLRLRRNELKTAVVQRWIRLGMVCRCRSVSLPGLAFR